MTDQTVATALLAAAPLATVIVAMAVLRWSAITAGAAGLAVALVLAASVFGITPDAVPGPAAAVAGIAAETAHSAASILWIILAALILFEYQQRSGGIGRIRAALAGVTSDRRIEALLIAWFLGLFFEGAAGFGTPVALAAPLLVGIGFSPLRAVTMALVGHAAGVPFGAVGTPTLAQIEITGIDPQALAGMAAGLNAVIGIGLLLVLVRIADDRPLTLRDAGWALVASVCFLVPFAALAAFTGPELPALAGAMIGLGLFLGILRAFTPMQRVDLRSLLPDLLPYLFLTALILATRLAPPVRAWSTGISFDWRWHDVFAGSFAPLYHPGTLMMASIAAGALLVGQWAVVGPSLGAALRRLVPVGIALVIMLALSRLMVHSGMIETLAATAALTGPAWPVLAPFVGASGTFVSGSATASNILFSQFQTSAAAALDLAPVAMAAAQGVGAAIGNIIAPHNIIAGCATVDAAGREGSVMRKTAPVALVGLIAAGLMVWAIA